MKKLVSTFLIIFTLLFIQTTTALASQTQVSQPLSGTIAPNAYSMISRGECTLTNLGNGTINISGLTQTFYAVDQLELTLNLQYYSGGNWYTLRTFNYSNYGLSSISGGQTLSVTPGYSYRIFAQHRAIDESLVESGQSYSSPLTI
jgi:hypothetical protein